GALSCVGMVEPGEEVCDGLDNDCDGDVDEDEEGDPLSQTCYNGQQGTAGVGICRSGVQTCAGGRFTSCVGEVRPATVELCNGLDDNCNGDTDEGGPGAGFVCTVPDARGVCSQGVTVCTDGGVMCMPQNSAGPEVCDGLDNDCDGLVDEDDDGAPLEQNCYDGPNGTAGVGTCRSGTQLCQGGRFGACQDPGRPEGVLGGDRLDNDSKRTQKHGEP
ncbi:MAG: MopE-related protein, partial [Myxococcota bacterium]